MKMSVSVLVKENPTNFFYLKHKLYLLNNDAIPTQTLQIRQKTRPHVGKLLRKVIILNVDDAKLYFIILSEII